jgi:hypothetical protein
MIEEFDGTEHNQAQPADVHIDPCASPELKAERVAFLLETGLPAEVDANTEVAGSDAQLQRTAPLDVPLGHRNFVPGDVSSSHKNTPNNLPIPEPKRADFAAFDSAPPWRVKREGRRVIIADGRDRRNA